MAVGTVFEASVLRSVGPCLADLFPLTQRLKPRGRCTEDPRRRPTDLPTGGHTGPTSRGSLRGFDLV
jgi:hypothetical protein